MQEFDFEPDRIFSDRVLFYGEDNIVQEGGFGEWLFRIINPSSYREENQKSIELFKACVIEKLGEERLSRICGRYDINFNKMSVLTARTVAQIIIGAKDIRIDDLPEKDRTLPAHWRVPLIHGIFTCPTEFLALYFHDQFLDDRERVQMKEEPVKDERKSMHNLVGRTIRRELEPGMLIPSHIENDFYVVSAKIVTGEGMVSYILHPAAQESKLEPVRLFRGTAYRSGALDSSSTVITDLEEDLGRSAYKSGIPYDAVIQADYLGLAPKVEAGHSLGGALVQYRLANMKKGQITKAFLFCSPGIPEKEAAKFNNEECKLIIRRAPEDTISYTGERHLWNRNADYKEYHVKNPTFWVHTHVYGHENGDYKAEPGVLEHLNTKGGLIEQVRSVIGPIFAWWIRLLRDLWRLFGTGHIHDEMGMKIGYFDNMGKWNLKHIRPHEIMARYDEIRAQEHREEVAEEMEREEGVPCIRRQVPA